MDEQSQIKAGAGGVTTIASTVAGFMPGLDPYLAFGAKVMAVIVGVLTATYYALMILEKIKVLRAKK